MPRPRKKTVIGIKLRVAAELLAQLEAAAKKSGHSFNAEAAMRLGKSFGEEAAFGGATGRRLMHFIMSTFVFAGERYYRDRINPKKKPAPGGTLDISLWIDEPKAYAAAMLSVIEQLMLHHQPGVTEEECWAQIKSLETTAGNHFANKQRRAKGELP
jgi:hypothetical protein